MKEGENVRKLRCTGKKRKRTEDRESNNIKKTCNRKDVKGDAKNESCTVSS